MTIIPILLYLIIVSPTSQPIPIVQQPEGQPNYVSSETGVMTEYEYPEENGVIGLLIHNDLGKDQLKQLDQAQVVTISDGIGIKTYRLVGIEIWIAEDGSNALSRYRRDADDDDWIFARDLYDHIYGGAYPLIIQTCIEENGSDTGGRKFYLYEEE